MPKIPSLLSGAYIGSRYPGRNSYPGSPSMQEENLGTRVCLVLNMIVKTSEKVPVLVGIPTVTVQDRAASDTRLLPGVSPPWPGFVRRRSKPDHHLSRWDRIRLVPNPEKTGFSNLESGLFYF
eukprot:3669234-Rhodomonas_salina.1